MTFYSKPGDSAGLFIRRGPNRKKDRSHRARPTSALVCWSQISACIHNCHSAAIDIFHWSQV